MRLVISLEMHEKNGMNESSKAVYIHQGLLTSNFIQFSIFSTSQNVECAVQFEKLQRLNQLNGDKNVSYKIGTFQTL